MTEWIAMIVWATNMAKRKYGDYDILQIIIILYFVILGQIFYHLENECLETSSRLQNSKINFSYWSCLLEKEVDRMTCKVLTR